MQDYAEKVNRVNGRHPVAPIETVRDYVPAHEHSVINFAERQARRKRAVQRACQGFPHEAA